MSAETASKATATTTTLPFKVEDTILLKKRSKDGGNRSQNESCVIELATGDLARLPQQKAVDLLIVNASPNDYDEKGASLIGGLAQNQGIHVNQLAKDKDDDLRHLGLNTWISKPLPHDQPYRRILVWEPPPDNIFVDNEKSNTFANATAQENVERIFASIIAMAKDECKTIAMPILASGCRNANKSKMLRAVINATEKWFNRGLSIQRITICMYQERDLNLINIFEKTKLRHIHMDAEGSSSHESDKPRGYPIADSSGGFNNPLRRLISEKKVRRRYMNRTIKRKDSMDNIGHRKMMKKMVTVAASAAAAAKSSWKKLCWKDAKAVRCIPDHDEGPSRCSIEHQSSSLDASKSEKTDIATGETSNDHSTSSDASSTKQAGTVSKDKEGKTKVVLSYSEEDAGIANLVTKSLKIIDEGSYIDAAPGKINYHSSPMHHLNRLFDNASRVIVLITPNFVRNLECLEQFNHCLLSATNGILQPILINDTVLPKYLQLVQFHDARPGRADKVIQALATIIFSMGDPNRRPDTQQQQRKSIPNETSQIRLRYVPQDAHGVKSWPLPLDAPGNKSNSPKDEDAVPPLSSLPSYDVFISYSSRLRGQATAAIESLNRLKPDIKCFIDVQELHAGAQWQQTLYNSLDNSKLILFILTPPFLESTFCREEAAIGALRSKDGDCHVVAVETIPVNEEPMKRLPQDVLDTIVAKERIFEACERAVSFLGRHGTSSLTSSSSNSPKTFLNDLKMTTLIRAHDIWVKEPHNNNNNVANCSSNNRPTFCVIGHHSNMEKINCIAKRIELSSRMRANKDGNCLVRIMTPKNNDVGAMDTATIMICILSSAFLKSNFCLNALNVGILRNRMDGGYLIPIAIEDFHHRVRVPSFVRLLPMLNATLWSDDEEDFVLQELIVSAAFLSKQNLWNEQTTLVSNLDASDSADLHNRTRLKDLVAAASTSSEVKTATNKKHAANPNAQEDNQTPKKKKDKVKGSKCKENVAKHQKEKKKDRKRKKKSRKPLSTRPPVGAAGGNEE